MNKEECEGCSGRTPSGPGWCRQHRLRPDACENAKQHIPVIDDDRQAILTLQNYFLLGALLKMEQGDPHE